LQPPKQPQQSRGDLDSYPTKPPTTNSKIKPEKLKPFTTKTKLGVNTDKSLPDRSGQET